MSGLTRRGRRSGPHKDRGCAITSPCVGIPIAGQSSSKASELLDPHDSTEASVGLGPIVTHDGPEHHRAAHGPGITPDRPAFGV